MISNIITIQPAAVRFARPPVARDVIANFIALQCQDAIFALPPITHPNAAAIRRNLDEIAWLIRTLD